MAGWLLHGIIIFALKPLVENIGLAGFFWLFIGGVAYTVGAVFYYLGEFKEKGKLFGFHEIFHLFVLFGSFSHFWLMIKYLI